MNPKLTDTKVDICYHCYFELSRYHFASGENMEAWAAFGRIKIKGTRQLYPEIRVSNLIHKVGLADPARENPQAEAVRQTDLGLEPRLPRNRREAQPRRQL